jgi:hypothetical protein
MHWCACQMLTKSLSARAMLNAPPVSATTAAKTVHCCRFANRNSSKYAALIVGSISRAAVTVEVVHIALAP